MSLKLKKKEVYASPPVYSIHGNLESFRSFADGRRKYPHIIEWLCCKTVKL